MATPAVVAGRHAALVGPTASGKSAVALAAARRLGDVELVSVDSMQVYRGMDVGTAKPTAAERAAVVHHLLDVADPAEEFTVARFARLVHDAVVDIESRHRRALLVGGTGLYLRAALGDLDIPPRFPEVRVELESEPDTLALHRRLEALDPTAAGRMEPTNRRRVVRALEVTLGSGRPFSTWGPGLTEYAPSPFRLFGLRRPRVELDRRIERRFAEQVDAGFVAEVELLAARPEGLSRTAAQALGYRELLGHVTAGVPLEEAQAEAVRRTRRFARRQERWFRRDPRIEWLDVTDADGVDGVAACLALRWGATEPVS